MHRFEIIFILLLSIDLKSQVPLLEHELGLGIGIANYYGDLNNHFGVDAIRPAATIFWRGNYGYRFCLKTSLSYMQLAGSDANASSNFQRQRNLSFHSSVTDINAQIEFNFLKYVKNVYFNEAGSRFTPYLSLGAGVFFFNPHTYYKGKEYALQPLGTEGQTDRSYTQLGRYNLFALSINYNCGLKFHLKRNISLGLDFQIHRSMSDYLDDVSGKYVPVISLPEADKGIAYQLYDRSKELGPAIGSDGRQRGSVNGNDDFANLFLTLSWTFFSPICRGHRY